jgi:hypothetical protein
MDYGQYVKNPYVVSHEEFINGRTKKKEIRLFREFRSLSDHIVNDNKGSKKNKWDHLCKPNLYVVHSTNERMNVKRNRDLTQQILSRTRSF